MPTDRTIRVVISSRCNAPVTLGGRKCTFSDLRRAIKQAVESATLLIEDEPVFDCWINEDEPAVGATAWEESLARVADAHIVVILYDGDPGWADTDDDRGTGICHAEYERAIETGRKRVVTIRLPEGPLPKQKRAKARFERFRDAVTGAGTFDDLAADGDEAIAGVRAAVRKALIDLGQDGVLQARRGRHDLGPALEWSRLNFLARQRVMIEAALDRLTERAGADPAAVERGVLVPMGPAEAAGRRVLLRIHAVPEAMSVAAAREMIGRPFLRDHEDVAAMGPDDVGPVHLIVCHKGVTERQAANLLGLPDVVLIAPPFGVLVAEEIQKIQMIFLKGCRSAVATVQAIDEAVAWLDRSREAAEVVERAASRRRIVEAIRAEQG